MKVLFLNSENRDRMIRVLEHVQKIHGQKHFNMEYLAETDLDEGEIDEDFDRLTYNIAPHCSTTACAVGWWNTYNPLEILSLNEYTVAVDRGVSIRSVSDWLNVSYETAIGLFAFYDSEVAMSFYKVTSLSDIKISDVIQALKELPPREVVDDE